MESKFVIFLVFASLAQSSYVPTLTVTYGLSEIELAVLNEIIANQEAKIIAYIDGFKAFFDILSKLAAELIFDLETETYHHFFKLVEAFSRVKDAVDLSLDTVLLAVGNSCSAVEVTRNTTHDYLDDALVQIISALKLAQCGNYSENRAAIEVYQAAVQKDFTNLVGSVYDTISTCLGTTDDDTSSVIENFQNKSSVGLVHVNNAVFNAIKVYAVAVTDGHADINLVAEIEDCRSKARVGLTTDVENEFSLYKTLYINSHLNQSGIVSVLAVNQYALTASFHIYKEINEIMFATVKGYLRRVALGLYDDGEDDYSGYDVALGTTTVKVDVGDGLNLDSILAMYPNASSEIATSRKALADLNAVSNPGMFNDILVAAAVQSVTDYTEAIELIQSSRNILDSPSFKYASYFFTPLRNNQTWDDETEAELTILEEYATYAMTYATHKFFDATETLANATLAGVATEEDFSAIQDDLDGALVGCNNLTQALSAAGVIMMKANNAS